MRLLRGAVCRHILSMLPRFNGNVSQNAKFLIIVIGAFTLALIVAFLLTGLSGPTDDDLSCVRAPVAECAVRRTRLFGLVGNSAFSIPESAIHGARSVCATSGRRGGCNVYLLADGYEQGVLVSSYALEPQADSAAQRLNEYFRNPAASSIEINESIVAPVLLSGVVPVAIVLLVLALRRRNFASATKRS